MFKNVNILKFSDDIQNHHEKIIERTTNIPISIGLEIPKIAVEISDNFRESQKVFAWQTNGCVKCYQGINKSVSLSPSHSL